MDKEISVDSYCTTDEGEKDKNSGKIIINDL